jgi:hypothetical protein
MLDLSIRDPNAHKWEQERLGILKSYLESKASNEAPSSGRDDHRCEDLRNLSGEGSTFMKHFCMYLAGQLSKHRAQLAP